MSCRGSIVAPDYEAIHVVPRTFRRHSTGSPEGLRGRAGFQVRLDRLWKPVHTVRYTSTVSEGQNELNQIVQLLIGQGTDIPAELAMLAFLQQCFQR